MWRVLNVVQEMSHSVAEAAQYLTEALHTMEQEMTLLQTRLHADAQHLRDGIEDADLSDEARDILLASLARVEKTADSVAEFAHSRKQKTTPTSDPSSRTAV